MHILPQIAVAFMCSQALKNLFKILVSVNSVCDPAAHPDASSENLSF